MKTSFKRLSHVSLLLCTGFIEARWLLVTASHFSYNSAMTMASKASKTVLFFGIVFVTSVYRIIFETKLWKTASSSAAANGDLDGITTTAALVTHPLERQLPGGASATRGTGGSVVATSPPLSPPPPRVQQEQQEQHEQHPQRWNQSNLNLYLRPDDGDFLFSNSSSESKSALSKSALPQWVHDYVTWHAQQLSQLTISNWNTTTTPSQYKYLILRCLRHDILCAGTADRLSTLPALLRFGYNAKRIIFIHWQIPAPLHEFLIPTRINWNIPAWLLQEMEFLENSPLVVVGRDGPDAIVKNPATVVSVVKLLNADYYDLQRRQDDVNTEEYSSYYITRSVWKLFFAPSPPVAALIQQELDKNKLKPGQYVATHIRSLYKEDKTNDSVEYQQAVICAAQLRDDAGGGRNNNNSDSDDYPIFVSTDSNQVTHKALEFGTKHGLHMTSRSTAMPPPVVVQHSNNRTTTMIETTRHENGTVKHHHHIIVAAAAAAIAAPMNNKEPLHLDRGRAYLKRRTADVHKHAVADFYDIFVDLYLLANAACVSYGIGRFGRLGMQLSYNISCSNNRRKMAGKRRGRNPCKWPSQTTTTLESYSRV